jgi:probable HAF family extracellular repeat protein
MSPHRFLPRVGPTCLAALLLGSPALASAQLVDMGTLGGNVCLASSTNNAAAAIGSCRTADGDLVPAYWAPTTGPAPLAALAVTDPCDAADINNASVIVGNCELGAAGEWFPVVWTASLPGGAPMQLKAIPNHAKAIAWQINHAGVVAGSSVAADGSATAVIWLAGSRTPTSLPELGLLPPLIPSTTECAISDMDNAAQPVVVGICGLRDGGTVAVRWRPGLFGYVATELPRVPGGSSCVVAAINSSHRVAGTCETDDGDVVAVRWESDGTSVTYLDYLEATGVSRQQLIAVDMNEAGTVLGNYLTDDGLARSFVWVPVGIPDQEEALDIGTLGGPWIKAVDIADNGSVVGTGQSSTGLSEAFVWTPFVGIQGLGTLGGFASQSISLSDDGSKLIGNSQIASGHVRAFMVGGSQRNLQHSKGHAASAAPDIVVKATALRSLVKDKIDSLNPEAKSFVNGIIEKVRALRPKGGEKPNLQMLRESGNGFAEGHRALSEEAKENLRSTFPKIHSMY